MVEAIGFLEALVRRLGRGWAARFGMIAPYGVYGLILTSDVGGTVEVVPCLVRGPAVIWSPFVFTRGRLHYELHAGDRLLLRTPTIADAVARLERWRAARGPAGRVAARFARVGSGPRRPARTTEVDIPPGDTLPEMRAVELPPEPTAGPAPAPEGAKPAARPGAKPAARPVAKPAARPVAKPAARPVAKPIAKPAIKRAAKPAAKSAGPAVKSARPDAKPTKRRR